MSAVTPARCHTHLAKSEHHVSFSFCTPNFASNPQPLLFGTGGPTSVV